MFAPIIPSSGLTGWRFLQRTYETQLATFSNTSQFTRNADYFSENIGKINTAEGLVSDRRLLEVALGAFGIQDDIDNRFFIKKILEEGTTAEDSLANRFSDKRYQEFSKAFGLGPGETSSIGTSGFVDDILSRYSANSFEVSAGQQDDAMRVALYAQRVLADFSGPPQETEETKNGKKISDAVSQFAVQNEDTFDYFVEKIEFAKTPEDLINDLQLLEVVLGAFGLMADFEAISSFVPSGDVLVSPVLEKIQRVFEEGSVANIAFANQLDNPAYSEMSKALGFGIAEDVQVAERGFADRIVDRFIAQNFEFPQGVEYDLPVEITNRGYEPAVTSQADISNDAKWFTIMGEPPLRALFERALNLPSEFGQIDIDQQLSVFKERTNSIFGSDQVSQFSDPEKLDELITKYVVRSQLDNFNSGASSAAIALTLLQS